MTSVGAISNLNFIHAFSLGVLGVLGGTLFLFSKIEDETHLRFDPTLLFVSDDPT